VYTPVLLQLIVLGRLPLVEEPMDLEPAQVRNLSMSALMQDARNPSSP
jgi:hypothetical protein